MYRSTTLVILTSACLAGCGGQESDVEVPEDRLETRASSGEPCEVVDRDNPLPDEVRETSGLARSTRDPGIFWTHNDAGNGPHIFAIGEDGRLIQRVRVTGAEPSDWEDLEAAPCGDGGACLYVGDIGDNDAERERITIYRVREPDPADGSASADPLHARFPDGPRDAEALFADGSGDLYVITKGRAEEVALYRYPGPQRPGETVTLERIRTLFPPPGDNADRVTAATSTPDGLWVGVRTYRTLYLYRTRALVSAGAIDPITVDLSGLAEPQGEAIAIADDGTVWVSSEAGDRGPRWSRLRCELPPIGAPAGHAPPNDLALFE